MPKPEQNARQTIDALLVLCGWVVQDKKSVNLTASRGVAVAELSFKTGEPDYTLFVDGRAMGVVEAKPEGFPLIGAEGQSDKYVTGTPQGIPSWGNPLPFSYETTGTETRFTNRLDPEPRSRNVFAFHRPESLLALVRQDKQLALRLREMPPLLTGTLWKAQIDAIRNLETSLAANKPRALIQMATGSGKTYTAVNFIYRLVKYGGARRVLFLVDRGNLGEQTLKEFQQFVSPVNNYKFTEEYIVQHLTGNQLDTSARVVIGTIQRLYSMLKGEQQPAPDLDDQPIESLETLAASLAGHSGSGVPPLNSSSQRRDASATIIAANQRRDASATTSADLLYQEPLPVEYNPAFPIESFDFIVTDECHRSIYNLWRQVLEYFDASLIGLTATPSKQTFGFFKQNLVMEYGHEKAVADGVNVGSDIYRIQTEITANGAKVDAGFYVDKRDRQTRKVRWEQLDEVLAYDGRDLDREVVTPDQIRTILTAFRDRLFTDIFPGRADVPKTLIFAKDDSHADDIVRICREVFGKGNDFCKKITYKTTGESPKSLLQKFRNSYFPRIAVTVDMIATGTDIKPLEIVFFMRSVASKNFFEQMKGRGVRIVSDTEMEQVNPGIKRKTRFVIIDAVGVCERIQTDSRPLEQKPTVTFERLLEVVALGSTEPAALESLAGRLIRLERRLESDVEADVVKTAHGQTLSQIARGILDALDPDKVDEVSRLLAFQQSGGGVPPLNPLDQSRDGSATLLPTYFDPESPIAFLSGDLPHWRQDGATYFVTFRLADSLPLEKLTQWRKERDQWFSMNPEPHDETMRREYYERFPQRLQHWLDAGSGSCVLAKPEVKSLVEGALRHFDNQRYKLDEFVVAANHVHVLVKPLASHKLSEILHSWKSYTAHEILKVIKSGGEVAPLNGKGQRRDVSATSNPPDISKVWQKESFDHIMRSPCSLDKFRTYIRDHDIHQSGGGVPPLNPLDQSRDGSTTSYVAPTAQQRRAAAATLAAQAIAPLAANPELRNLLKKIQKAADQTIDIISKDALLYAGPAQKTAQNQAQLAATFRDYIETHKAEIAALQILYSRPYRQRLTEPMLKELETKLRENHAGWTEDRLWDAFAAARPGKVKGRSQPGRFADLVALVRFALEQQPVLKPFADSVHERFNEWLMDKAKQAQSGGGLPLMVRDQRPDTSATSANFFSPEQLTWLNLIRDHIATSVTIEPSDFDYAPFSQQGGLGKAYQLFGADLNRVLAELNEVLVA